MKRFRLKCPGHDDVVIVVDDEDAYRLRAEVWKAKKNKRGHSFEIYRLRNGLHEGLGRALLGVTQDDLCVIHKNGDSLDLRRINLRIVTARENLDIARLYASALVMKEGHCARGHPLTQQNITNNSHAGSCRICKNAASKRRYRAKKIERERIAAVFENEDAR